MLYIRKPFMQKRKNRYWVPWLFLLGILVIVFLQVVSGYNITRLIDGNKSLSEEIQIQSRLHQLYIEIVTVESDIRSAIISNDSNYIITAPAKIRRIRQNAKSITESMQPPSLQEALRQLEKLVEDKTAFSEQILSAFSSNNGVRARELVNTERGKFIRDSIEQVLLRIDGIRQADLLNLITNSEKAGQTTRIWGLGIAGIALAAVILAFWYILNQGRQQQKMITLLNESEKRSKDVAEMKEQFLANMSHEIRTPMNAILGFTNLLRRTQLSQDQRQYVQNIHSAGENLLALVNDILDLSKMEAGMMKLEETRFSLHSLMSSVGAMFGEKIKEKQLAFTIHIDKEVPDILSGDAVRLTQIMVNLLSNAVKFTERGTIEINVKLVRQSDEKAKVRIKISDTGIGISEDKLQSIFERFHQAETETSRRFGGTGLGLAIVRQLVLLQNGTISVNSKPDEGTEFIVELTYSIPDINQIYTASLVALDEDVSLRKITVLIAEDNNMNQQLISHLMKSWDIDFVMVNNGKQVIAELKNRSYSLVLMDIQMPEMDGYEATRIIRNELKQSIPIIAMTAHAMAGEREKCIELGMNDYVSKPIKETVLYNLIGLHAQNVSGDMLSPPIAIQLGYLEELSGGDKEFERSILEQFLIQAPQELDMLEKAIENNESESIKQVAHSMKSTVGYIGLSSVLEPYLDRIEMNSYLAQTDENRKDFLFVKYACKAALAQVSEVLS